MADLVDKAESELAQIVSRITTATTQRGLQVSATVGKKVAAAPFKAAVAAWHATSKAINPEQGKVSLKQFSQLAEGKRDVVQLDDKAVSREFERELQRHGVTWTVEAHRDGSRTFHIQGKDAELIQHALGVAASRVDDKIARGAPELQAEQQRQPQHREPVQAESIGTHGTDELREDAPARSTAEDATPEHDQTDAAPGRDEAVADRGGHSQQRETPAPTADRPPRQLSPRDETRVTIAERIKQKVQELKDAQRQKKDRTRSRTATRDAAAEARDTTRRR